MSSVRPPGKGTREAEERNVEALPATRDAEQVPSQGGELKGIRGRWKLFKTQVSNTYKGFISRRQTKKRIVKELPEKLGANAKNSIIQHRLKHWLPRILNKCSAQELKVLEQVLEHPKNQNHLCLLLKKETTQKEVMQSVKSFLDSIGKSNKKIHTLTGANVLSDSNFANFVNALNSPTAIEDLNKFLDISLQAQKNSKSYFKRKSATAPVLRAYNNVIPNPGKDKFIRSLSDIIIKNIFPKTNTKRFAKNISGVAQKLSNNALDDSQIQDIEKVAQNSEKEASLLLQFFTQIQKIQSYSIKYSDSSETTELYRLMKSIQRLQNHNLNEALDIILNNTFSRDSFNALIQDAETVFGNAFTKEESDVLVRNMLRSRLFHDNFTSFIQKAKALQEELDWTLDNITSDHPMYQAFREILSLDEDKERIKELEKILVPIMCNALQANEQINEMREQAQSLVGERFDASTMDTFENMLIKSPEIFRATQTYLDAAKSLQNQRPTVYRMPEDADGATKTCVDALTGVLDALMKAYKDEVISAEEYNTVFIQRISIAITEYTAATNTQPTEENLGQIYSLPPRTRDVPLLHIDSDSHWRIAWEHHPYLQIHEDDDAQVVDLNFSTEVYWTDPNTMESFAMRNQFPFTGEMTHTEARVLIEYVRAASESPKDTSDFEVFKSKIPYKSFEEIPQAIKDQSKIDFDSVEDPYEECLLFIQSEILAFTEESQFATAEAIANFNSSDFVEKGWVPRSEEAFQEFADNPTNPEVVFEAASTGHIFSEEAKDRLTLLPPEHENEYEQSTTVPKQLVTQVSEGLKEQDSITLDDTIATGISEEEMEGISLPITFSMEEIEFPHFALQGIKYLKFTMSIEIDIDGTMQTFSRTKYYPIERDEAGQPLTTREEILDDIAQSGLLERDLLIAKAQFMRDINSASRE